MKEPDPETMCRGKPTYLPPRFMTVNTAIEQLLEVEDNRNEVTSSFTSITSISSFFSFMVRLKGVLNRNSPAVGMARLGQPTQMVRETIQFSFLFDSHSCSMNE